MYIISFDSATKSLAISITYYNVGLTADIKRAYDLYLIKKNNSCLDDPTTVNELIKSYNELLEHVTQLYNEKIQIKMATVVDLIPDKKIKETDTVYRTKALYDYLNNVLDPLILQCGSDDLIFLLEYQMGPNIKSGTISSQIMYFLMKYNCSNQNGESNIKLIGPSLKNKVAIGGKGSEYSAFVEKYSTNYACNKAHAKHNLYKLLEHLDQKDIIKNIHKKNHDDIADSILMGFAWFFRNHQ